MSDTRECERFRERLDRAKEGTLSAEENDRLTAHMRECVDCTALFRLHRHCALGPDDELESKVPSRLLEDLEQSVLAEASKIRTRRPAGARTRSWLVPLQTAAILLLVVGAAYLAGELRAARSRERMLLGHIEAIGESMGGPGRSPAWMDRGKTITAGELERVLALLPPERIVVEEETLAALRDRYPLLWSAARARGVTGAGFEGGLRAGEAVRILRALALDPGRTIPVSRLLHRASNEA